jgi:hypothetical protein
MHTYLRNCKKRCLDEAQNHAPAVKLCPFGRSTYFLSDKILIFWSHILKIGYVCHFLFETSINFHDSMELVLCHNASSISSTFFLLRKQSGYIKELAISLLLHEGSILYTSLKFVLDCC